MLAGVAVGVARHLGLPVAAVRVGLALLAMFAGAGAAAYVWLWAFVPTCSETPDPLPPSGLPPVGLPPSATSAPGNSLGFPTTMGPGPVAALGRADGTGVVPGAGIPGAGAQGAGADTSGATSALGAAADRARAGSGAPPGPVPAAADLLGRTAAIGRDVGDPLHPGMDVVPTLASAGASGRGPGPWSPAGPSGTRDGDLDQERPGARGRRDVLVGLLLVGAGLYVLLLRVSGTPSPGLVIPAAVVLAGTGLALTQLDEVDRRRGPNRRAGARAAGIRLVGGLALVISGALLFALRDTGVVTVGRVLLAVAAVLCGGTIVLAPWLVRLWRSLDSEREARAREAERAEIAAHLHDSVLQTLALIQRRSADPVEVARLARAQERDLRGWLYARPVAEESSLAAAVTAAAAEVEELHGVVVEVVTVGDRTLDERGVALVAALREAVLNAARHAGAPVQVYLECGPTGVEAFVRDRGVGFDPDAVPADRHGISESIIARVRRYGGRARVRSSPGEGTEVSVELPDRGEKGSG